MKKTLKKLDLKRATVRLLSGADSTQAAGGLICTGTSYQTCHCISFPPACPNLTELC